MTEIIEKGGDGTFVTGQVYYGPAPIEKLPLQLNTNAIPLSSCWDIGKQAKPNTFFNVMISPKGFLLLLIGICCAFGFWHVNKDSIPTFAAASISDVGALYSLAPELIWIESIQWFAANVTLVYIPILSYHLVFLYRGWEGGFTSKKLLTFNNSVTWAFLVFALICVSFFPLIGTTYQPLSEIFFYSVVMPALTVVVVVGAPHTQKLMRVSNGSL